MGKGSGGSEQSEPCGGGCVGQPLVVLSSLLSALPVNGDVTGAADMEEERPAAGATMTTPMAPSTADGPAAPALSSSGEPEEAAPGSSTPQARAAVLALDALPPG